MLFNYTDYNLPLTINCQPLSCGDTKNLFNGNKHINCEAEINKRLLNIDESR